MDLPIEMSPQEFTERQSRGEKIVLVDVREPQEFAVARVENSRLLPMQSLPSQLAELSALADETTIALLCHHGVRSLNAAFWLRQNGIANCVSISGGIDRWSRELDPEIPRY